jgi:hypothetical protein
MNKINTLKSILNVVIHADRELSEDMPLHQVKSLFHGLQLDFYIDFEQEYGKSLRVVLDSKNKTVVSQNIINARYLLVSIIQELEKIELNGMTNKIANSESPYSLPNAEKSNKAREKNKTDKKVTVNAILPHYESTLYNADFSRQCDTLNFNGQWAKLTVD